MAKPKDPPEVPAVAPDPRARIAVSKLESAVRVIPVIESLMKSIGYSLARFPAVPVSSKDAIV